MVDTFKNVIALGILALLPLIGIVLLFKSSRHSSRSRMLEHITDRYDAVHQAMDDFMNVMISYLPHVVAGMDNTVEQVRSLHLIEESYSQTVIEEIKELGRLTARIEVDNPNSESRSSTKTQIIYGDAPNPFRSWLIWLATIGSMLATAILYLLSKPTIHPIIIGSTQLVGILILIFGYRRHGQSASMLLRSERYASLKVSLYDTRREFIHDTTKLLQAQHVQLMKDTQRLSAIPQARGFFSSMVMLSKLANGTASIHRASNMQESAPLFAVSVYLQKLIDKKYAAGAAERHVGFAAQIDPGLSFQIYPRDLEQLMDIVLANAIMYSKPGTKVTLRGKSRRDTVIISVTDNGIGIDKQDLQYLFNPLHKPDVEINQNDPPKLGLQISKVIMARIGGELKIASKLGKGTVATIYAPRKQTQMDLNIRRHVITGAGRLN